MTGEDRVHIDFRLNGDISANAGTVAFYNQSLVVSHAFTHGALIPIFLKPAHIIYQNPVTIGRNPLNA